MRDPQHHTLVSLDASGNEFSAEHLELVRMSLVNNKSLTSLDLRSNPGYSAGMFVVITILLLSSCSYLCYLEFVASRAIADIEELVHNNECDARTSEGHP